MEPAPRWQLLPLLGVSSTSYLLTIILTVGLRSCPTESKLHRVEDSTASQLLRGQHTHARLLQDDGGDDRLVVPVEGHPLCPCLTLEESLSTALTGGEETVGNNTDLTTYGIGCDYHDATSDICTDACEENLFPTLVSCDRPWCQFAWCYVDHNKCELENSPSAFFPGSSRYYSYGTCRYPDVFKHDFLLLKGETIRIGLNSNTGGWTGSYHVDGTHFKGSLNGTEWSGPTITYIKAAAEIGDVTLDVLEPPAFLTNRSAEFFGPSPFDRCVYAVSLGFLDMCVAAYTITEERAGVTDWIVLNSQDLWLVTESEDEELSGFQRFSRNLGTIFQPFTGNAWMFIILFVIPFWGVLMVIHERGKPGSAYPAEETVIRTHKEALGEQELLEMRVPLYQHIAKAVYVSFLSVLQIGYGQPVVSLGAQFNLLGVSFFILTLWAVYTANLAAILTEQRRATTISSLEDALNARLRFCATRQDMEIVSALHDISPLLFVKDPEELGGDGKPGFACEACRPRQRVFDFLNKALADTDDRYCHATVAPLEDLDVEHANSNHCNKNVVGTEPVGRVEIGMPIFDQISQSIIPLLLKLKNNGVYDLQLIGLRPEPVCGSKTPSTSEGEEDAGLTIEQLTGIWVVSFGFAIFGLLVTCVKPWWEKHHQRKRIVRVSGSDQWGQRVDMLEPSDAWVAANGMVDDDGRVFVKTQEPVVATISKAPSIKWSTAWMAGSAFVGAGAAAKAKSVARKLSETDHPDEEDVDDGDVEDTPVVRSRWKRGSGAGKKDEALPAQGSTSSGSVARARWNRAFAVTKDREKDSNGAIAENDEDGGAFAARSRWKKAFASAKGPQNNTNSAASDSQTDAASSSSLARTRWNKAFSSATSSTSDDSKTSPKSNWDMVLLLAQRNKEDLRSSRLAELVQIVKEPSTTPGYARVSAEAAAGVRPFGIRVALGQAGSAEEETKVEEGSESPPRHDEWLTVENDVDDTGSGLWSTPDDSSKPTPTKLPATTTTTPNVTDDQTLPAEPLVAPQPSPPPETKDHEQVLATEVPATATTTPCITDDQTSPTEPVVAPQPSLPPETQEKLEVLATEKPVIPPKLPASASFDKPCDLPARDMTKTLSTMPSFDEGEEDLEDR